MSKRRINKGFLRTRAQTVAAVALLALLAACSGPSVLKNRHASTPSTRYTPPPSLSLRQCHAKLLSEDVRFNPLPDQNFGHGCSAINSVKLIDFGVPATNLGAMTCGLAANFAAWAKFGVQPAARLILGSEIVRIDTYGTYNCRPIAGSDRLSEHAHSNAIDIAGFGLANGRTISVRADWNGDRKAQQFLRIVRASACKRFRTVLSPDYNSAHHDHLHFDMGGKGGYCR
jgi:hypothetical protein